MCQRRKAFSLIEAVVAFTVMGFLMTGVYWAIIYGFRHLSQTITYSDVQQQALLAMRNLTNDLGEANFGKVDMAPDAVTLLSPRGLRTEANDEEYLYTGGGLLLFRKWVGYYRNPTGDLVRAEIDVNPDVSLPDPIAPPPPATVMAVSGALRKVVARSLTSLQVVPDASVQTLSITLIVRRPVNSTRNTELTLTTQVRARH